MGKIYKNIKDVQVGDEIQIGVENHSIKIYQKVFKINKDKITTDAGDIFNKDGSIFRRKSLYWAKGKKIFAVPVSQRFYDKSYRDIKMNFIKTYDWNKESIETIEFVIDQMKIIQANKKQFSRFK